MDKSKSWEDFISLNSGDIGSLDSLERASRYSSEEAIASWPDIQEQIRQYLPIDKYRMPLTVDREGYYGDDHFSYWASGLRDWVQLKNRIANYGVSIKSYLDLGCASGRVIRHAAIDENPIVTFGCDINQRHIRWGAKHLAPQIQLFQNTSIPLLPISSNSLDLVTAYSVFSHIEAFDTSWLMEIRRILRPGGIAWITIHSDNTLLNLTESWPVYSAVTQHPLYRDLDLAQGMPTDRMIFRWKHETSYSSNIFYRRDYIEEVWARILTVRDWLVAFPNYQDTIILQKE